MPSRPRGNFPTENLDARGLENFALEYTVDGRSDRVEGVRRLKWVGGGENMVFKKQVAVKARRLQAASVRGDRRRRRRPAPELRALSRLSTFKRARAEGGRDSGPPGMRLDRPRTGVEGAGPCYRQCRSGASGGSARPQDRAARQDRGGGQGPTDQGDQLLGFPRRAAQGAGARRAAQGAGARREGQCAGPAAARRARRRACRAARAAPRSRRRTARSHPDRYPSRRCACARSRDGDRAQPRLRAGRPRIRAARL
jgi:hypothetical protein